VQLEENRQQLVASEETYKKLVKTRDIAISDAQAKIEKLKRLISETEMMEAQAELQEMAKGVISEIGGAGDTLARVEEYLNERRDKAAGRARVAAGSIDTSEVEMKEAEQVALAEQALAEFEMAYGFKTPATEESKSEDKTKPPSATVKDLGPQG